MSADVKIKTIAQVYDAFGRGDVAAILDAVTDDVDWAAETTSARRTLVRRTSRQGRRRGSSSRRSARPWRSKSSRRVSFAANDTDVLTVVRFRARSRSTGKTAAMDLHHYFRFRDGKIAYYRGTEDTAQTEAVLRD